jgi:hypothetical protein
MEALLQYTLTRDVKKLGAGQVVIGCATSMAA